MEAAFPEGAGGNHGMIGLRPLPASFADFAILAGFTRDPCAFLQLRRRAGRDIRLVSGSNRGLRMLSVLVGMLMLAAGTEVPPASEPAPPPEAVEPEAVEPGEAEDPAEAEAAEPDEAVTEDASQSGAEDPASEEEVEQVCHRRTEYDMLGRQRSRRVCRPR